MTCDRCAGAIYCHPEDQKKTTVEGREMELCILCEAYFAKHGKLHKIAAAPPAGDLRERDHEIEDQQAFEHDHRWGAGLSFAPEHRAAREADAFWDHDGGGK